MSISFAQWIRAKRAALGIYTMMGVRRARRALRQRANVRRLKGAKEALPVVINSPVGLFAHLSWCLKIVSYCRAENLVPYIRCTSPQYGDNGEDWFNVLFDQPAAASLSDDQKTEGELEVNELEELPFYTDARLDLTVDEASALQKKFFPIASHIQQRVDQFTDESFITGATVGCHFRGTDKGIEASRIAYDEMTLVLKETLARFPSTAVLFVATDEAAFIEHVRKEFPGAKILCADHERSRDGQALHLNARLHGRSHGEEALLDSLLLSRCDLLVKSPSALSAWSKVFNPQLQVTLVGRPYPHAMFFPESALVEAAEPTSQIAR